MRRLERSRSTAFSHWNSGARLFIADRHKQRIIFDFSMRFGIKNFISNTFLSFQCSPVSRWLKHPLPVIRWTKIISLNLVTFIIFLRLMVGLDQRLKVVGSLFTLILSVMYVMLCGFIIVLAFWICRSGVHPFAFWFVVLRIWKHSSLERVRC